MIARIKDFDTVDRYAEEAPSPSDLNDLALHVSTDLKYLNEQPLEDQDLDHSNN